MNLSEKVRTATGRYPRGEETKQRIIDVADDMFGRAGYAGTSTREIAAAANVNTPAIQYYFKGKLGLYTACVDRLTGRVWQRIGPAIHACQMSVDAGDGVERLIATLGEVQGCLIDAFFSDDEGEAIRRLMAWEDVENGENPSQQLMEDRIGSPVFQTFRRVVERVVPARMARTEIEMHAMSLMGLSTIFHFNQSRVMHLLNWSKPDDVLLGLLKAVAQKQLGYALTGLSGAAAAS